MNRVATGGVEQIVKHLTLQDMANCLEQQAIFMANEGATMGLPLATTRRDLTMVFGYAAAMAAAMKLDPRDLIAAGVERINCGEF